MTANGVEDISVKRKPGEENECPTAVKIKKIQDSTNGEGPSQTSSTGGEITSQSSTGSVSSASPSKSTQSLTDSQASPSQSSTGSCSSASASGSTQHATNGVRSQNGNTLALAPPSYSPQKNCWLLELTQGEAFDKLMWAFSKMKAPDKITYDGTKYNLTEAFEEFWEHLFSSPDYTSGYRVKLINNDLPFAKLLPIVRILRRGWEDERFFPKKLAQPLLEACLFNVQSEDEIELSPKLFYKYIDPIECKVLKVNSGSTVDEESLKIFQKYCPGNSISVGDKVKKACIKVLTKIMYRDVESIRRVWTPELVGLLEYDQFKFIVKEQPSIPEYHEIDVLTTAPHRLWGTFFYDWSNEMKDFYFDLLRNDLFESCTFCYDSEVDAKHILSTCESNSHFRMRRERHDCILRMIVKEVTTALDRSVCFSANKNWKIKVMSQNYISSWPPELHMLEGLGLYPHIIVWSMTPKKRALVMEITISWDYWIHGSLHYDKVSKYSSIVNKLKLHGFKAKYYDIIMGSRGILSHSLYNLFDEVCGMKHSDISKIMEEISRKIIKVIFNFQNPDE